MKRMKQTILTVAILLGLTQGVQAGGADDPLRTMFLMGD